MARRERRRTFRVEWNSPARIRYHGSRTMLPCVVHDLSNTGARITAPNVATCRVIWRTKFELGVEFVSISPAVTKEKSKRVQIDMSSA